jgi:hypothetical protein
MRFRRARHADGGDGPDPVRLHERRGERVSLNFGEVGHRRLADDDADLVLNEVLDMPADCAIPWTLQ